MFICSPRALSSSLSEDTTTLPYPGTTKILRIPILERHPYTTQTFIPLGLAPTDRTTAFIVVVAPTLPSKPHYPHRPPPYPTAPGPKKPRSPLATIFRRARPEPFTNNYSPPSTMNEPILPGTQPRPRSRRRSAPYTPPSPAPDASTPTTTLLPSFSSLIQFRSRLTPLTANLFTPRGTAGPDLTRARAFVAHGGQGVTYAPGTWHAPMAVVGSEEVEFVVVQFGNGVRGEDTQEMEVGGGWEGEKEKGEGEGNKRVLLEVVVDKGLFGARAGLGISGVRARL